VTLLPSFELSDDQESAIATVLDLFAAGRREVVLGGLAGTGKTTILRTLLARGDAAIVCGPTARSCFVLNQKGLPAQTVHSLIYSLRGLRDVHDEQGKLERIELDFVQKLKSRARNAFIALDESSMVSSSVAADVRSLARRILWVGDHGQLAPVGDDPRIMSRPDVVLERIHRQAEGSAIVRVAHAARAGKTLARAVAEAADPATVDSFPVWASAGVVEAAVTRGVDVVIAGRNSTRAAINRAVRLRTFGKQASRAPVFPGEKVVGLKNNYRAGVINGEVYSVVSLDAVDADLERITVTIRDSIGLERRVHAWSGSIGVAKPDQRAQSERCDPRGEGLCSLDYAYALTCHKAQGGEWDHVLVVDEEIEKFEMKRWRYTAASRARKKLTVAEMVRGAA
jgi:exodeoxyribonuclease V